MSCGFSVNAFTFSPVQLHSSFLLPLTCAKPCRLLDLHQNANHGHFAKTGLRFTRPFVVTSALQTGRLFLSFSPPLDSVTSTNPD